MHAGDVSKNAPFHQDAWVYEEKYDGYRILAYKEGRRVTLLSRNSNDRTAIFSVIAKAVARLRSRTLLLDGEVVAFDSRWVSRFQLLQNMKAQPSYVEGELRYVGKVGAGFDKKTLAKLFQELQPLVRQAPSVTALPRERGAAYVTPRLVAEVAYEELTADQKLRQPVFLGLRDDKRPQDVTLPEAR